MFIIYEPCTMHMDDYSDDFTRVNSGYGKPKFSRIEIRDIFISIVVLAAAFTIMYRNSNFITAYLVKTLGEGAGMYLGLFGISLALVVVSFLFHEFGHKFVAQKAGMWSEYRMFPAGLGISLVMSYFGFLFAAPGAVYISGNMDDRTNGRISIAGPAVNVVFAAIALACCMAFNGSPAVIFFYLLASLNSFLAVFNLLPIPPFDGSKILKWNAVVWVVAMAIAVAELLALWYVVSPDLFYTY